MKLLLATIAAASIAAVTSTTATGALLQLPHKPFAQMTRTETVKYLKRQLRHDRSIIRFAKHHSEIQTVELRSAVKWAKGSIRIVQRNLQRLTASTVHRVSSGAVSGLLCIHRYEGAWNDPNAPYWGGLQMDMNFQRAYGGNFLSRWGTADHWPVYAQLQAGLRAVRVRGYTPWPNTARLCGLLP